jgi:hypothetical protein
MLFFELSINVQDKHMMNGRGRMSEMGSGVIEMALLFGFLFIAIVFFLGLYILLKWVSNKGKPQKNHESSAINESKNQ